jgi:hypothetical protein
VCLHLQITAYSAPITPTELPDYTGRYCKEKIPKLYNKIEELGYTPGTLYQQRASPKWGRTIRNPGMTDFWLWASVPLMHRLSGFSPGA